MFKSVSELSEIAALLPEMNCISTAIRKKSERNEESLVVQGNVIQTLPLLPTLELREV